MSSLLHFSTPKKLLHQSLVVSVILYTFATEMNEITVKESVVANAAAKGMDEFVGVFVDAIKGQIGELNAVTMASLNADQVTLLAWDILHQEVMDGGFVQLLHNGYGPFFFNNPFGKMMRNWHLDDVARLLNKTRKLFGKYQEELEKEVSDEEFMQLYEKMPEFDDLDDCFVENEEQWTGLVACFIDEHIDRFAKVEQ